MICDQPAVAVAPAAYHLPRERPRPRLMPSTFPMEAMPATLLPPLSPLLPTPSLTVQTTVKHACRTVVTEHCVDNPIVKHVPVEVEHCHTVTKVACEPVDNEIPTTQCEPVTTEHLSHAAVAAPVAAAYHYGK